MMILSPHCGVASETTSGAEHYERELLTRLAAKHDVHVLLTGRAYDRAPEAMWTRHRLHFQRGLKWWTAPAMLLDRMRELPRPDLLRVHSLKIIGPSALYARRTFWPGVKLVAHHHHLDPGRRPIERFVSDRMDRVIVGSHFALRQMQTRGWRTDHVRVVPYGVDPERFTPSAITPEMRVGSGYLKVIYFGGLKHRKNLGALLGVWQQVAPRVSAAGLVIAGGGALLEPLKALVARQSIPRVRFLGYVKEADKPAVYRSADVFVFPSTLEGFGLPVLEAMASGLPCVVSTAGDFRDWIGPPYVIPLTDDMGGRLWASTLEMLLRNDRLRQVIGRENRARVETMTWDRCVTETVKVYEEVV